MNFHEMVQEATKRLKPSLRDNYRTLREIELEAENAALQDVKARVRLSSDHAYFYERDYLYKRIHDLEVVIEGLKHEMYEPVASMYSFLREPINAAAPITHPSMFQFPAEYARPGAQIRIEQYDIYSRRILLRAFDSSNQTYTWSLGVDTAAMKNIPPSCFFDQILTHCGREISEVFKNGNPNQSTR